MAFVDKVEAILDYYGVTGIDVTLIELVRSLLESKYRMQANREVPSDKEDIFAELVAIRVILDSRSKAQQAESESGTGLAGKEVKSITVGDTRTEFATSGGGHEEGSKDVLDQNSTLDNDFNEMWRALIVSTRRLF